MLLRSFLLTVVTVVMLPYPTAFASVELVSSDPPAGAIVRTAPTTVSLTFSEAVDAHKTTIVVLDERDQRVEQGAVEVTNYGAKTISVAVKPLAIGVYRVIWRAEPLDRSKLIKGKYEFTVAP